MTESTRKTKKPSTTRKPRASKTKPVKKSASKAKKPASKAKKPAAVKRKTATRKSIKITRGGNEEEGRQWAIKEIKEKEEAARERERNDKYLAIRFIAEELALEDWKRNNPKPTFANKMKKIFVGVGWNRFIEQAKQIYEAKEEAKKTRSGPLTPDPKLRTTALKLLHETMAKPNQHQSINQIPSAKSLHEKYGPGSF